MKPNFSDANESPCVGAFMRSLQSLEPLWEQVYAVSTILRRSTDISDRLGYSSSWIDSLAWKRVRNCSYLSVSSSLILMGFVSWKHITAEMY